MEQDDCSSCSSFPLLESSNEYEIVTIGAECVYGLERNDERKMFLVERLLSSIRQAAERARLGQDDGGVPESDPSILRILWTRIPRLNIYEYWLI